MQVADLEVRRDDPSFLPHVFIQINELDLLLLIFAVFVIYYDFGFSIFRLFSLTKKNRNIRSLSTLQENHGSNYTCVKILHKLINKIQKYFIISSVIKSQTEKNTYAYLLLNQF